MVRPRSFVVGVVAASAWFGVSFLHGPATAREGDGVSTPAGLLHSDSRPGGPNAGGAVLGNSGRTPPPSSRGEREPRDLPPSGGSTWTPQVEPDPAPSMTSGNAAHRVSGPEAARVADAKRVARVSHRPASARSVAPATSPPSVARPTEPRSRHVENDEQSIDLRALAGRHPKSRSNETCSHGATRRRTGRHVRPGKPHAPGQSNPSSSPHPASRSSSGRSPGDAPPLGRARAQSDGVLAPAPEAPDPPSRLAPELSRFLGVAAAALPRASAATAEMAAQVRMTLPPDLGIATFVERALAHVEPLESGTEAAPAPDEGFPRVGQPSRNEHRPKLIVKSEPGSGHASLLGSAADREAAQVVSWGIVDALAWVRDTLLNAPPGQPPGGPRVVPRSPVGPVGPVGQPSFGRRRLWAFVLSGAALLALLILGWGMKVNRHIKRRGAAASTPSRELRLYVGAPQPGLVRRAFARLGFSRPKGAIGSADTDVRGAHGPNRPSEEDPRTAAAATPDEGLALAPSTDRETSADLQRAARAVMSNATPPIRNTDAPRHEHADEDLALDCVALDFDGRGTGMADRRDDPQGGRGPAPGHDTSVPAQRARVLMNLRKYGIEQLPASFQGRRVDEIPPAPLPEVARELHSFVETLDRLRRDCDAEHLYYVDPNPAHFGIRRSEISYVFGYNGAHAFALSPRSSIDGSLGYDPMVKAVEAQQIALVSIGAARLGHPLRRVRPLRLSAVKQVITDQEMRKLFRAITRNGHLAENLACEAVTFAHAVYGGEAQIEVECPMMDQISVTRSSESLAAFDRRFEVTPLDVGFWLDPLPPDAGGCHRYAIWFHPRDPQQPPVTRGSFEVRATR